MVRKPSDVRDSPEDGLGIDAMKGLWIINASDTNNVIGRNDVEVLLQYEWEVGYDWDKYIWTITQAPEDDETFVATLSSGLNKRAVQKTGDWQEVCSFVGELSRWLWEGEWSDNVSFDGISADELEKRLRGER